MAKRNRNTTPFVCAFCGKAFLGNGSQRPRPQFCSRSCSASRRTGSLNPHWRGGLKRRGSDGRAFVYAPGHPNAPSDGRPPYVLRYRIVAEALIGRPLRDDEIVHHIDGDPTNDDPSNLQVMSNSAHSRYHGLAMAAALSSATQREDE